MKTLSIKAKLINCFFALTLVTGLCVPSIASYAYAEPTDATAGNAQAYITMQTGDVTAAAPDQTAGSSNDQVSVPGTPGDSSDGTTSGVDQSGTDAAGATNVPDAANTLNPNSADTTANPEQGVVEQQADQVQAFATDAEGYTDYNGLSIKGGTPETDYGYENKAYNRVGRGNDESAKHQNGRLIAVSGSATLNIPSLVIKQNGTYTIKNTNGGSAAVGVGIYVSPGVKANITLDNVNINVALPFNIATNSTLSGNETSEVSASDIANKTTVHLTLADNSVNTLYCAYHASTSQGDGNLQFPGLRCGEGSVLVVDDAVENVDSAGRAIVPSHGKIPAGTTYRGNDGDLHTAEANSESSSLSNLDSKHAGTLNVYGGIRSAAIGGGPVENSGDMTFNGGNITATANDPTHDGSGCGIGGGHAGGGTTTTINGGKIEAKGSYHGAGIGGGCTYTGGMSNSPKITMPLRDALLSRHANSTIAGDITINGGYVSSVGWYHSNAFGQGCGGSNEGHTILITGGTLLPSNGVTQMDGYLHIGGKNGFVVITGGSVNCGKNGDVYKFQGNNTANPPKFPSGLPAGQAYGDEAKTYAVDLVSVDVTSKIMSMVDNYNKEHPESPITADLNAQIESWDFKINKMPYTYGAPARLDNGKLYLWLPQGTFGNEQIDANFSYYVGDQLLTSNTMVPSGATEAISKEYEIFNLDDEFIEKNWNKYYDGTPIPPINVVETPIDVNNPAGGQLNEQESIEYNYQKINNSGEGITEAVTSKDTPSDAGRYYMEVRSTQYGAKPNEVSPPGSFAATYWGHRAIGEAKISPVMSKTSFELKNPITVEVNGQDKQYDTPTWIQDRDETTGQDFNTATNNHLIVPVDITSWKLPNGDKYDDGSDMSRSTCLAPTGRLQLYIDGKAVPASLGGVKTIGFDRTDPANPKALNGDTTYWVEKDAADNNREHVIAYFDLTRSQLEAFGLEDKSDASNMHDVYVAYTSAAENADPRDPATAAGDDNAGDELAGTQAATAQADDTSTKDFIPAHNDSAYTNYYESQSDATPVEIELTSPDFTLYNEAGTGFVPGNTDAANTNKLILTDTDDKKVTAEGIMAGDKPGFQTDVSAYRDETDDAGNVTATHDNWFPLYIQTNSIGNITFTSSNPSVITIEPVDKTTDREYVTNKTDYGIGAKAIVHSAGMTTITATINGTGAYSGATQSFDVYMFPDLAKEPKLEASMIARDDSRTDGSIRPGDKLVYTTTATNTTPDSALVNPVYTIDIPAATEFNKVDVYDASGNKVDNPKHEFKDGKLTFNELPTLFGGESFKFVVTTTATPDAIKAEGDDAFTCKAAVNGIYGVNPDKFSWDDRIPAEGLPAVEATAETSPTLPDPNPTPKPQKPGAEEILGGDLVDPTPTDPDNPDNPDNPDPDLPGVEVQQPAPDPDDPTPGIPDPTNPLGPDTPFGGATTADPTDPTKPADPDKPADNPIKPGDRIIEFGDKDDPKTPDDIQDELDDQIKKKLEEDPDATEVEIPVKVWTPDPDNPDPTDPDQIKDVIITVPIPEEYKEPDAVDPKDRDDHDLVVIPDDVDPRVDGDITTTKTMENITDGFDKRKNKSVALVGDTIRYTITVENTKAGSAWYSAIVKDPLPKGLEYIPGTTKITLPNGQVVTDFETDYTHDAPTIGFCLGDIYGGEKASVSFEVKVAKGSQTDESQSNIAYAYGTEPSDTLIPNPTDPTDPDDPDNPDNPDNPNDPDRPIKQVKPDTPVGPYDPTDEDKTWDDIDEETKKDIDEIYPPKTDEEGNPIPTVIPGTDPTPTTIEKIISSKPKHEELRITLSAQNETRTDGYTYVGDLVTYTIDIENLGDEDTNWLDVIARADIPQGLNFIPGSIVLTTIEGEEISVSDAAYNNQNRILALNVGNIPGGKAAKVVFRAEVTLEAINKDIGMTAHAYGTMPDEITEDYVAAEPGTPFVPEEGWALFEKDHFSISNTEKVYPSEYVTAQNHVKGTPEQEKLAKTSDFMGFAAVGVGAIAIIAAIVLILARKRIQKNK